MLKYPDSLPLDSIMGLLDGVLAGTIDLKYAGEAVGFAINKFIGEVGEALVTLMQAGPPVTLTTVLQKIDAAAPPQWKQILKLILTLLLTL